MQKKLLLPVFFVALSACAPKNFEALQQVANDSTNAIGCANFESKTWDAVNRYLQEEKSIPTAEELKEHFKLSLVNMKAPAESLTDEKLEALAKSFEQLFEVLLQDAPKAENVQDAEALFALLSALELGDHTTDSKVKLQSKVETQFTKIRSQVAAMNVECTTPETPEETGPEEEAPREMDPERVTVLPLPVFGMRFTFATAYQSCQSLSEPIMSDSTSEIAQDAIKITGMHSDGVGSKRIISSLPSLLATHPYYKNVNSYGSKCLKGSTYPMIYDYGGKPYAAVGSTTLNMFKNAGGGTSVLGMDCSGYIYSALATAGLRLKPGTNMKASGVSGISSTMYVEPQKNGLSCLAKITLTPTSNLKAGDIVAVPGHVLMIDSVGNDPFGLNGAKTTEDCEKLSVSNYDFVVIQSSPSKNAVGMNRYQARNYLPEAEKMKAGLERYAYYACLARVNNQNYTPNLGTLSVIRHKMTSTCVGSRLKLTQESCIQSCPQLVR
ncbi:hypothetical protein [Bdellovibrio sp. HCB337]|uniref:hypothetical protein n=1 Tax=Bdellovibrio sp. HCB337 TaxID=3394358 RepID=UPI0039A45339